MKVVRKGTRRNFKGGSPAGKEDKPSEYHYTLKELPEEMRPRERLALYGAPALSNAELLAILLGSGASSLTALELAQRLLAHPRGFSFLAEGSLEELEKFKGIGLAKAAQIKAALELGFRASRAVVRERVVIKSPGDAVRLVKDEMRGLDREHFRVMILGTRNQLLALETVSIGGLNSAQAHPREIFKEAIKRSGAALILLHNHPSGDPTPSQEDVEISKRILEAGKILGIEVLDHVIIGGQNYLSFREKDLF